MGQPLLQDGYLSATGGPQVTRSISHFAEQSTDQSSQVLERVGRMVFDAKPLNEDDE